MKQVASHRVLATREAREGLPSVLKTFRREGADARPVVIGAHRKPEGVLMSYERYLQVMDELDNLAIIEEVEERLSQDTGQRTELDDVMREFGYDPADFKPE